VFSASVRWVGDENKIIRIVASFCGAGVDDRSIDFAIACGADAIVSSDWKHHLILACHEAGVAVFELSHYASEEYGFEKYYEKMCKSIELPCVLHREEALL
jgi:putative NIF3 family GTP cyclohydrolase 1 type 2